MTKYLQDKLISKYPILFPARKDQKNSPFLAWGIECDDGWYDLIDDLFKELNTSILKHDIKDFQITCIKQKFAGLRVHVFTGFKAIYPIIEKYEKKSFKTCEITGKPGKVMCRGYWLKTLCEEQAAKLGYAELTDKNNTELH